MTTGPPRTGTAVSSGDRVKTPGASTESGKVDTCVKVRSTRTFSTASTPVFVIVARSAISSPARSGVSAVSTRTVRIPPATATSSSHSAVWPSSSVTVSVTTKVSARAYVWVGVAPLPVVPSPKSHA